MIAYDMHKDDAYSIIHYALCDDSQLSSNFTE